MTQSEWSPEALSFAETTLYDAARLCVRIATVDNKRSSLAWMRDIMFRAVADELEDQKISKKVAGDMLGMSSRNYHRLRSKQHQEKSATLWRSILSEFRKMPQKEAEIALKFPATDIELLRSVIVDMKKNGFIEEYNTLLFAKREAPMDDEAVESYLVSLRMKGRPLDFSALSIITQRSEDELMAFEAKIKASSNRLREASKGTQLLVTLNNLLMQTHQFCSRALAGTKPDFWRASLYVQPIRENDEVLFEDLRCQLLGLEEKASQILDNVEQDERDTPMPCVRWSLMQTFGDLLPYRERKKK